MKASIEAIKTATRVLAALTERKIPDPADVESLRALSGFQNGRDLDELACDVIQQALKHRAEVRGRARD